MLTENAAEFIPEYYKFFNIFFTNLVFFLFSLNSQDITKKVFIKLNGTEKLEFLEVEIRKISSHEG